MWGDPSTDHFTSWFSEEDEGGIVYSAGEGFGTSHLLNERYCNAALPAPYIDSFGPAMVAGYKCSGSYCDNQALECVVPKHSNGTWGSISSCFWSTTWYSEESPNNGFWYSTGRFIVGVRCSGSYCDSKQFYSCIWS
jgi:hypothetical protein